MTTTRFGPADLLEYNSVFKVLICRECQYAIQNSAVESHLLRHKIYRGDRQRLLSIISRLELLVPGSVQLPALGSLPIESLPILDGLRCMSAACDHLTVSTKRMKLHWKDKHGLDGFVPLSDAFAQPVKLQTFFRGTKVRYFEVASSSNHGTHAHTGNTKSEDHRMKEQDDVSRMTQEISYVHSSSGRDFDPVIVSNCHPTDFDLQTMKVFHYFITITFRTIPGLSDESSSRYYWQSYIPSLALQHRWLMCGILAMAAQHSVFLAGESHASTPYIYEEQRIRFRTQFFATRPVSRSLHTTSDAPATSTEMSNPSSTANGQYDDTAEAASRQIEALLLCAEWFPRMSTADCDSKVRLDLPWVLLTIQHCVTPRSLEIASKAESLSHRLPHVDDMQDGANMHDSSAHVPPTLMNRLLTLPLQILERLGRPKSSQEVLTVLAAIDITIKCCEISFRCNEIEAAWQGVATWLTDLSGHFNELVQQQHPAALVVLAHWAAILVRRAEYLGCWFLRASTGFIVNEVMRQLSHSAPSMLDLVEELRSKDIC